MFKFIGVLAAVGGVALGVAIYTGTIDFHTDAKLTEKGQAQVQSARESVADSIRGVANKAATATAGDKK